MRYRHKLILSIMPTLQAYLMNSMLFYANATSIVYEFIATCASNDSLKRYKVLLLVANPCLAAINRAVWDTLGDHWFAILWEVVA
jgi:hypothetical protein